MIKYFLEDVINKFQEKTLEVDSLLKNCKHSINGSRLADLKKSIKDLIGNIKKSQKELETWNQMIGKREDPLLSSILQDLNVKLLKSLISSNLTISLPQKPASIEESKKYLYYFDRSHNLLIFDTENETIEIERLEISDGLGEWNRLLCITPLPNNESFGILYTHEYDPPLNTIYYTACIFDCNYKHRFMSSIIDDLGSSIIYFNKSVYCFGINNLFRFSLDESRWIKLASPPLFDDNAINTIFNGNILMSGYDYSDLLLYSIDIDSFSRIHCSFIVNGYKIVINLEDRLYVIENWGFIYESEVANYTSWSIIASSTFLIEFSQASYVYNKGELYIGCCLIYESSDRFEKFAYYKFNLDISVPIIWNEYDLNERY